MARGTSSGVKPPVVRCGWESIVTLLGEANTREMLISYWEELSPVSGAAKLDPDFDQMARAEKAGQFKIWACRVDGTLAGYISFHITPHLNCKSTLFAIDAGHYLSPAFRDDPGRLGLRMWRTAEVALRKLGVKVITCHDNASRTLLPFFLHLGYSPRAILYYKVLD